MLQFKPFDSLVATADYTYTFYKDMNRPHTFGAWFDYGPNPTSATINSHGTVTDLVDTGSDLSYFAANDQFINQNGSAGFNVKWQPSDNIDGRIRRASLDGRFGRWCLGQQQFRHRGSDSERQLAQQVLYHGSGLPSRRTVCRNQRRREPIPTTSWIYAPPYTMSNLGTNTITPLFGQANNNVFRT